MAAKNSEKEFWAKVNKTSFCWLWNGGFDSHGYGSFSMRGKKFIAHRLAWTFTFGEIPTGLHVCHTCDNRQCVNPHHMFLGTNADNVADRQAKGRTARGNKSGARQHPEKLHRKLNSEQVTTIRESYKKGNVSQRELARKYRISQSAISKIVHNQNWRS